MNTRKMTNLHDCKEEILARLTQRPHTQHDLGVYPYPPDETVLVKVALNQLVSEGFVRELPLSPGHYALVIAPVETHPEPNPFTASEATQALTQRYQYLRDRLPVGVIEKLIKIDELGGVGRLSEEESARLDQAIDRAIELNEQRRQQRVELLTKLAD